MIRRAAILTGLALVLSACSGVSTTVDQSRQQVTDTLISMPPSANVFDMAKQVPKLSYASAIAAEGVAWTFSLNGKPICRFLATLDETAPGKTHVSTSVEDVSGSNERYLCQMARITGEESVRAAIEGRDADVGRVQQDIQSYVIADTGAMFETVSKRMDEAAAELPDSSDDCESDNFKKREACLSLQAVRRDNQRDLDPVPPGTFRELAD